MGDFDSTVNISTPVSPTEKLCDKFEENLIHEVFSRPYLYDKGDTNYSKRKRVANAWKVIAVKLGKDVESCKRRWRSLRDQFLKKSKEAKKSGDGVEDDAVLADDWKWYNSLLFLKDVNEPRPATDSLLTSSSTSTNDEKDINCAEAGPVYPGARKRNPSSNTNQWTSVVDKLTGILDTQNDQDKELISELTNSKNKIDPYASYLSSEMEKMTENEQDEFKYQVSGVIRQIKKARVEIN